MQQTVRTVLALALTLIPVVATADKRIEDIPTADPKAPLGSWTPVQQWRSGAHGGVAIHQRTTAASTTRRTGMTERISSPASHA
jgi:hypothetical protein